MTAAFWGGVAGSSLIIGALLAIFIKISARISGFVMAFGTGVLIGAASFELLSESVREGGITVAAIGFLAGATIFTISEFIIAKKGGKERKTSSENPEGHSGLAIFIGTLIDAIPESVIIGVSLLEGPNVSWLMVAAIFLSNLPEGMSSTLGLQKDGYSRGKIMILWAAVLVLSSASAFAGYFFLEGASEAITAGIGAFAAGGIIAMVSATMMPEAFEEGGPAVGFISALGVLCSLILTHLE